MNEKPAITEAKNVHLSVGMRRRLVALGIDSKAHLAVGRHGCGLG